MKYLTVVDGKLATTDKYEEIKDYALVFPSGIIKDAYVFTENPIIVDDQNAIISNKVIPLKDIEVVEIDDDAVINILQHNGENTIKTRDIRNRIPNPITTPMAQFASIVCLAIHTIGKAIPLDADARKRKANLIRLVNVAVENNKDITLAVGFELLRLNGVNPEDIFKPEFIKK